MSSGSGDRTSSWIPLTHYIPCIRSGCVRGGPLATNPVFFLRKRLNYVSSWNHIFTGKTEMAIIFSQLPKHTLPSIHVFSHKTSAVQSLSPCWLTTRYCFGVAAVGIFFFLAICLKQFEHGVFVFQAHWNLSSADFGKETPYTEWFLFAEMFGNVFGAVPYHTILGTHRTFVTPTNVNTCSNEAPSVLDGLTWHLPSRSRISHGICWSKLSWTVLAVRVSQTIFVLHVLGILKKADEIASRLMWSWNLPNVAVRTRMKPGILCGGAWGIIMSWHCGLMPSFGWGPGVCHFCPSYKEYSLPSHPFLYWTLWN